MTYEKDDLDRRFDFQRQRDQERQRKAEKLQRENREREDERRKQSDRQAAARAQEAKARQEASFQNAKKMHDLKRAEKLQDDARKTEAQAYQRAEDIERDIELKKLEPQNYARKLDADYQHSIRTRNLDIQQHGLRSELDADGQIRVADNTHGNDLELLKVRLRDLLVEMIVGLKSSLILSDDAHQKSIEIAEQDHTHRVTEAEVLSRQTRLEEYERHMQRLTELEAEGVEREREINALADAKDREIWTKNEAQKNLELFRVNLARQGDQKSTAEIADILRELESRLEKTQ